MAVGSLRLPSVKFVDGAQAMAEDFADKSAPVFIKSDPVDPALCQVFNDTMPDVVITDKVFRVLQDLNCDSAVEPDHVYPRVLKACASQITIFNMCLAAGLLLDMWLQSVVIPLLKAKLRYDPGNYCPNKYRICMLQGIGKSLSL